MSYTDSIHDEDFSAKNTWGPVSQGIVHQVDQLAMGWKKVRPRLSYKMVSLAVLWFMTGAYEFAAIPFIYEPIRRMVNNRF